MNEKIKNLQLANQKLHKLENKNKLFEEMFFWKKVKRDPQAKRKEESSK